MITISTLFEEKNQKYPVSVVSGTACAVPLVMPRVGAVKIAWTRNLPLFRQSVVGPAVHVVEVWPQTTSSV